MWSKWVGAVALLGGFFTVHPVRAQTEAELGELGRVAQVALQVPEDAEASAEFDVERATRAYMDLLSPEQRARSDAYFEGGYWISLWNLLLVLGVAALVLFTRVSAWLRERTSWTRFPALNAGFFGMGYAILAAVLTLPWTIYTGFLREHQYNLSTQSFGGWLRDWGMGLGVTVVFALCGVALLYAVFRRAQRRWWLWGSGVAIVLLSFTLLIQPVFIAPLFNAYKPLPDGAIRSRILSMAHANGIPAEDVYWFNASRQSKRISANVSGFGPTTRISLNDNLLLRSPEEGIEAVMGHEMGHYVLHHVNHLLLMFGLVIVAGFAFVAWGFRRLTARFGARWGVEGIADPGGWPALIALFSIFLFLATPVTSTIIRTSEIEADYFGLNAARQPDGFASTAIQLSEYRKLAPGRIEELIFFDHPSGHHRVHAAMQWKAEHLADYGVPRGAAANPRDR